MLSSYLVEQRSATTQIQDLANFQAAVLPFDYILGKKQVVVWAADRLTADTTFSELQMEYCSTQRKVLSK